MAGVPHSLCINFLIIEIAFDKHSQKKTFMSEKNMFEICEGTINYKNTQQPYTAMKVIEIRTVCLPCGRNVHGRFEYHKVFSNVLINSNASIATKNELLFLTFASASTGLNPLKTE